MTLVGALVVAELGIVGIAAQAIDGPPGLPPFAFESQPGGSPWSKPAASDVFDRSFIAGPTPHVVVDVVGVHVIVQTSSAGTVRVLGTSRRHGWISGSPAQVKAVQTVDGVRVSVPPDDGPHFHFGSFSRSVEITVPPTAFVEVIGAERVDAGGLRAKFVAHIVEGPIYVKNHRGDIDVSCADGRIVLNDVQGSDIAANTRNGRLLFTSVGADRIDAVTNSGRIAAVDLRAVDGVLLTHDGRINVSFTGTTDATVNVHTGDGHVHVAGLPSTDSEDRRSMVHLGSGRGHFEVSSGDGSITITQGASV